MGWIYDAKWRYLQAIARFVLCIYNYIHMSVFPTHWKDNFSLLRKNFKFQFVNILIDIVGNTEWCCHDLGMHCILGLWNFCHNLPCKIVCCLVKEATFTKNRHFLQKPLTFVQIFLFALQDTPSEKLDS